MAIDMWRVRFSSAAGDIGDYRDKRERERDKRERTLLAWSPRISKRSNEDNEENGREISFVKSSMRSRRWTRAKRA